MTILPFVSRARRALMAQVDALLERPDVLRPAERDDYTRWNRFVAATVHGDDLRLRVGLSTPRFLHERPPLRDVPALSLATLTEECRDCDDPVALSMLVVRCMQEDDGPDSGDAIALARRWTTVEPDNHLAWVVLATLFWSSRDTDRAVDTMREGSGASCWREHEVTFAQSAVAAIAGPYFTSRQRLCAVSMVQLLLLDRASDSTFAFLHEAARDRTLRPLVVALLAAQWRDADSPHALSFAGMHAAAAGLDDTVIAERTRRADAYSWAQHLRTLPAGRDPRSDAECDAAFERAAHAYRVGARREFMETLAAAGLDEAGAARLHLECLDAHGLQSHRHLMTPSPLSDAPMRGPISF